MSLHYRKYGSGTQTLLVLHGLFGSLDNWHSIASVLSEFTQVITVDLRNHGHSFHNQEMNYQLMAEDLANLMNELNLTEVTLLGHSMGGKLAMEFADLYPNRVNKLVIVDMAPRAYDDQHSEIINALLEVKLDDYQHRKQVDLQLSERLPDKLVRQFLLMNLKFTDAGLSWRVNLQALRNNYPFLIKAVCVGCTISIPTYFIRGELSEYINDTDIDLIYDTFIYSDVITIDGAGHWVHAEKPQQFLRVISDVLDYA